MSYSHLPLDTKSGDNVEGVPMIGYSYPPTLDREGGDNLNYPSRLEHRPGISSSKITRNPSELFRYVVHDCHPAASLIKTNSFSFPCESLSALTMLRTK